MIDVGLGIFPDVGEDEKGAAEYFAQCLDLVEHGDSLGFHHVRIVEHYFRRYGGYSPNPVVFLSAASQRSRQLRLITGAVLPAFNHPLKLAGEIGMLDAISGGRAEIGFARAFLPHEFQRFGVDMNESRARFDEGILLVRDLLTNENVVHDGLFHSFPSTTSLPRPTQKPHPPFWIAALSTAESFQLAGELGFGIMAQPVVPQSLRTNLAIYRKAWKEAGHPGQGRVMLAFHMLCMQDGAVARALAREPINRYLRILVEAASEWTTGTQSDDYVGYRAMIEKLATDNFDRLHERGSALVGTPAEITEMLLNYHASCGGFEFASVQFFFHGIPIEVAHASLKLFATEVMPALRKGHDVRDS
ncbi:LLM class flavin-dependent oxidoreductase [Antrihabitans stalactiti]|uniref:LLM class flavin-dependent oxidoreductase n=1 Tax=Antrihabitans stalactiti TaxID=2584121 RepID=A0A848KCW7_9NOCA|nr:LLM class flavin-dependent oxidoreductase [Antrihabitans stalactiti]NMN96159.1 LLM class flavin-dependent oxidoreductase [Antrihabitans stalactiti]